MATNNSINSPIGNKIYSLSPYVVGSDNLSQYTTIQSAINAAHAAGASASNQATIYIKNGTYTSNLTLYDGINLKAFDYQPMSLNFSNFVGVIINGNISISSSSTNLIYGIAIIPPSAAPNNVFTISGSGTTNLTLKECFTENVSVGSCFNITSTGSGNYTLDNCYINAGNAVFIHSDDTTKTLTLNCTNSLLSSTNPNMIDGSGVTLIWDFYYCQLPTSFLIGSVTQIADENVNFWHCIVEGDSNGDTFFVYNHLGEGLINTTDSTIDMGDGVELYDNTGNAEPAAGMYINNCTSFQALTNNFVSSAPQGCMEWTDNVSNVGIKYFKSATTGFTNAFATPYTNSFVMTTNATATTLATVNLLPGQTTIVKGYIVANTNTLSDHMGAEFTCVIYNNFSGRVIVGTPLVVYYKTAGVLATALVSFTDSFDVLNVQVTGVAATNVSWAVMYQTQSIGTSS